MLAGKKNDKASTTSNLKKIPALMQIILCTELAFQVLNGFLKRFSKKVPSR